MAVLASTIDALIRRTCHKPLSLVVDPIPLEWVAVHMFADMTGQCPPYYICKTGMLPMRANRGSIKYQYFDWLLPVYSA